MARLAISFSNGIRSIAAIERFLGVDRVISPRENWTTDDEVVVLVWGRKSSSKKALGFAKSRDLPVMYLEDGFIRSCSADPHSRTLYSLVADPLGVYYDSTQPSSLETLLNSDDDRFDAEFSAVEIELTQACLEIMTEFEVVKYNFCREYSGDLGAENQTVVLVIDQTVGDASVVFGGMDRLQFHRMLDAAIEENPDSQIVVKTHPDVVSGRKQGYLTSYAKKCKVRVIADIVNPISLLKQVDKVYVGTSQMGMEALMLEKEVIVFGSPFYAGWGLTDDRTDLPRRTASRSLLELFFAVYLWYPRYCHPVTGEVWSLPDCLEHVLLQKRRFAQNARTFQCIGITPWKRGYVKAYLRSPDGSISFHQRIPTPRPNENTENTALVTWGFKSIPPTNYPEGSIIRVEDGFLRSSGLGSDYSAPLSLVLDEAGLYFNAGQTSGLEQMLNDVDCHLDEVLRAKRLINLILSAKLSKYNLVSDKAIQITQTIDQRVILVVGQVESDASIRYGCTDINTNAALLTRVKELHPDACIMYKPHPDVVAGNRQGKVSQSVLDKTADHVVGDIDIISCIELASELHTMTSLSGFEALLRGKKVVTYGLPFYAGWGLTTDMQQCSRRSRNRTLEELVYFTLIQYPTYLDIASGEFVSPENFIQMIAARKLKKTKMKWPERQYSKLLNVCKGLSYAP